MGNTCMCIVIPKFKIDITIFVGVVRRVPIKLGIGIGCGKTLDGPPTLRHEQNISCLYILIYKLVTFLLGLV